jgi:exopolyphosphatase/pppGpp-phosphohydrolase
MGEPFDGARNSTVGADKMILELRQTTTTTLDLQRAEVTSLMERAVLTAAADKLAAFRASISKVVATNASRDQVSNIAALLKLPIERQYVYTC